MCALVLINLSLYYGQVRKGDYLVTCGVEIRGREVLGARAHARTSLKALMTERKFFFSARGGVAFGVVALSLSRVEIFVAPFS